MRVIAKTVVAMTELSERCEKFILLVFLMVTRSRIYDTLSPVGAAGGVKSEPDPVPYRYRNK